MDIAATLLGRRGFRGRVRPTLSFRRATWAAWRGMCGRLRAPGRREDALALGAAACLVALLIAWVSALVAGWWMVWIGLEGHLSGSSSIGEDLGYAAGALLPGGGAGVVPTDVPTRLVSAAAALSGVASVTLVIVALPGILAALRRREARLLTLDDPGGERLDALGMVALHGRGGNLPSLLGFLHEWELWIADVLDSHLAQPLLVHVRSRSARRSWLVALSVILDTSALVAATIPGAEDGDAYLCYRRGRLAVQELCRSVQVRPSMAARLDREEFLRQHSRLAEMGFPVLDAEAAFERCVALRAGYAEAVRDLAAHLAIPLDVSSHPALGSRASEPDPVRLERVDSVDAVERADHSPGRSAAH